jgi:hypothetical protein
VSIHPVNNLGRSAAGIILGTVALVLVTALLSGALFAYRAAGTIDHLSTQLSDARTQIDGLSRDNDQLTRQYQRLVNYLHRHGVRIPESLTGRPPATKTPGSVSSPPPPKAHPTAPGSSPNPTTRPTQRPPASRTPVPTPTPTIDLLTDPLALLCDLTTTLCLDGLG